MDNHTSLALLCTGKKGESKRSEIKGYSSDIFDKWLFFKFKGNWQEENRYDGDVFDFFM